MARFLLLGLLTLGIVCDGYLCGRLNGRWSGNAGPTQAAARLEAVPMNFGDWRGQDQELDAHVVELARFSGYKARRYTNQRTGAMVNLLVAAGPCGPLSVHTPEICYGASGFGMVGQPSHYRQELSDGTGSAVLWKATFARPDALTPEKLRVIWSWNKDGTWLAPDQPRWTLSGSPYLYKLYVSQMFYPANETVDGAACLEFLKDFLPEFDKTVAPQP